MARGINAPEINTPGINAPAIKPPEMNRSRIKPFRDQCPERSSGKILLFVSVFLNIFQQIKNV